MAICLNTPQLVFAGKIGPITFPPVAYPSAQVETPPKGTFFFFTGSFFPLDHTGYQTKEFFYSGEAFSYLNSVPLQSDGKWQVAPARSDSYRSRMIVYRPEDPADFNGTVLVEWLNVSGGTEAAPDWIMLHDEIVRRGYAWVGVSAQQLGVEGGVPILPSAMVLALKKVAPRRYRTLLHPGDSFSYDIFSQAARAVRFPVGLAPLGDDLQIQHMIAVGESQSAHRLMTFVNAFGKSTDLFDGYYIHSRLGNALPDFRGGSAPLSQAPQDDIIPPTVVRVRGDLGKPVMNLQTETDVFTLGSHANRQEDNENFRLWEVAGTAHADINSSGIIRRWDDGELYIKKNPIPFAPACPEPVNSAPQHHFVAKAALDALSHWIVDGIAPSSAPWLAVNTTGDGFEYDEFGNVLGGVRSPYVDVPIARLSGENTSVRNDTDICFLFGETELFDDATLQSLYPDHATYVNNVKTASQNAVTDGFLLLEDAQIIINVAEASVIPQ